MTRETLRTLASDQLGLVTSAQATVCGVSRVKLHRMVQDGELRLIRRGIYAFASAPLVNNEELRAAWLTLDPAKTVAERLEDPNCAVICTTSAAQVFGIGDFQTYQHKFFTPVRKQSNAEDIHLRRRILHKDDVQIVDGLKVTSPTRIVLDLLNDVHELEHIAELVADGSAQNLKFDWLRIESELPKFVPKYELPISTILATLHSRLAKHQATDFLTSQIVALISNQIETNLAEKYLATVKSVNR